MRIVVLLLCLMAALPTAAVEREEYRLDNGLHVILLEARSRQVCVVVLYRFGSERDPAGKSGLSHLTEHMLVARKGANAQTGWDYTVFGESMAADQLDAALADAAARMRVRPIDPAALSREKQRVLSEISNMFGSTSRLGSFNVGREKLFPTPRGGRRGGTPAEVHWLSAQDVESHIRRYYGPQNATLVLAGNFDKSEARRAIARHFGGLVRGDKAPRAARPAVSKGGILRHPSPAVVFPAPAPGDRDYPCFIVAMTRLADATYAPLDEPSLVYIANHTPATLNTRLKMHFGFTTMAEEVRRGPYGWLLGLVPPPDEYNLYGLAFGAARRRQMGIHPKVLGMRLNALRPADYDAFVQRWLRGPYVHIVP